MKTTDSLLRQAFLGISELTKESAYETNSDVVLNLNSETTSTEPVEKISDDKGSDDLVKTLKEENKLESILVISGTENLKDMVSDIEDEIKDNIKLCEVAEETILIVEVAETELKEGGKVTTETSLKLVEQYNKLLVKNNTNNNLSSLTIETGSKYPKEVLELTKESAESTLNRLKDIVIDIIKKIVVKIQKLFITAVGIIDNVEKASKAFEELASGEYTDVVIERFEDNIPFASIQGRMAMISDITSEEIIKLIKFTNRGADLESLIKEFIEGIKKDDLSKLKELNFVQNAESSIYKSRLLKDYPDEFKDVNNILPLRLSGNNAIVLCSVFIGDNDYNLVIKEFKIEISKAVKTRKEKLINEKDSKYLLSRADLIDISQELSKAGRGQREGIKNSLAYLDKIKVAAETVTENSKIKNELPKVVSALTRAVFTNTYSGTFSNRMILGFLGEYIGLYEKQNQTKN